MISLPLMCRSNHNQGTVSKVQEKYVHVDSGMCTLQLNGNFAVRIGDTVEWTGEKIYQPTSQLGAPKFVVKDASLIKILGISGFQSYLYDAIRSHPVRDMLWTGVSKSDIYDTLSLQMVFIAVLHLMQFIMKFIGNQQHASWFMTVFLIVHGSILGFHFAHVYLVLRMFFSKDKQMVFLIVLYPEMVSTALFGFVYGIYFIKKITPIFETIHNHLLRIIMSSFQFGVYNPILQWTFKMRRICIGLCLFLSLCIPNAVVSLLRLMQDMMNHVVVQRFNHVGVIGFSCIFMMLILYRNYQKNRVLVIFLHLFWIVQCYYPFQRITFINVGQGDASLVQKEWGLYNVLVDTGRQYAWKDLKKSLYEKGVRELDILVLTHEDLDHIENTADLVEYFRPKQIVIKKGEHIYGFEPFLEEHSYAGTNENSLIFRVWQDVLLMGDSGVKQEEEMIRSQKNICASILKLGHHGSKTSSSIDFLHVVKPQVRIVSAGITQYGHPHPQVLRLLYDNRIKVFNTASDGNITVNKIGDRYFLHTSKGKFDIIKPVIEC